MQLNVVSYWRLPIASTSFTCCCMRDSRGFSGSPVAQADGTPFAPDCALSPQPQGCWCCWASSQSLGAACS